jgi:hypothetical protein
MGTPERFEAFAVVDETGHVLQQHQFPTITRGRFRGWTVDTLQHVECR